MEPTNFDDFIKSNTGNDLPVPAELNWENMNFPMPPVKRKRRILLWMLFFLIGAFGIGGGLWYVYKHDITQSHSLSKNDPVGIQNQNSKINLKREDALVDRTQHPQDDGENTVTRNKATNKETSKKERIARADSAHSQDAGENTVTVNNDTNKKTSKTEQLARAERVQPQDAGENTIAVSSDTNKETSKTELLAMAERVQPQDAGENTIAVNNDTNKETSKTDRLARVDRAHSQDAGENTVTGKTVVKKGSFKKEQPARIEIEEGTPMSLSQAVKPNEIESEKAATLHQTEPSQLERTEKANQASLKLLDSPVLQKILPVEPDRSTSSEKHLTASFHADSNTKHVTKSMALLVSIGTIKTQMNHNSARLNDAVTPAWGNSFQILLERELKSNWLLSIGLGYQRLHTTFYFEKDLGTFINPSQLQVIRKTRRVFHNNYTDLVSLNIGGGKQFKFSPRWHGQFLMYLSPTRRVNYTGKSIDDSESIVAFDPNAVAQKKWLLNADASFRFSYTIKKTDLIMGLNLSQSLTKSDLRMAGNGLSTVQPRVFGLNLGIKRALGKRK